VKSPGRQPVSACSGVVMNEPASSRGRSPHRPDRGRRARRVGAGGPDGRRAGRGAGRRVTRAAWQISEGLGATTAAVEAAVERAGGRWGPGYARCRAGRRAIRRPGAL